MRKSLPIDDRSAKVLQTVELNFDAGSGQDASPV